MRLLAMVAVLAASPAFAAEAMTPPLGQTVASDGGPPLPISFGAGLHYPDVAGIWASVKPLKLLSVEGLVTFNSVLAGLALHWPESGRHDIFLEALGGYRHGTKTHIGSTPLHIGGRAFIGAGWDYTADAVVRLVVGASIEPQLLGKKRFTPEAQVSVGVPL